MRTILIESRYAGPSLCATSTFDGFHLRSATNIALIATLLATGCAAENSPEACSVVPLAEMPMRLVGNLPVVDVTVGGRPARFLVDTGASAVLITEAAFDRLGLRYDLRIIGSSTSVGSRALSRVTEPAVLSAGPFKLEPTPFMVVPSATALPLKSGIDGLLGTTALAGYDVDIDMPRRRMSLNKARRCPVGPPPFEGLSTTFRVPPNTYHWFYVPVTIDGKDLSLVVDTGANRTYLNEAKLSLSGAALQDDRSVPINTAGPAEVAAKLHRFRRMRLGNEVRRNPVLVVGPLNTGADGLLGTDMLRSRRIWLSFAGWAVTIGGRGDAATE